MLSACSRCKTSTMDGPLQRALRLAQRDQMESIYISLWVAGHTDATFSEVREGLSVRKGGATWPAPGGTPRSARRSAFWALWSPGRPAMSNRRVAPAEWRAHYTHGAIRRASGQCEGGREQGARNVGARALLKERAVVRRVADLVSWARSEA